MDSEKQICRHCHKPKGEHHDNELWCFDSIEWFYSNKPDTKFEPQTICKKCGKDYEIYGSNGICDDCKPLVKKIK